MMMSFLLCVQLLEHVKVTSPECNSDTDYSQFQTVPTISMGEEVEGSLLHLLQEQQSSEQGYVDDVLSQAGSVSQRKN